MTLFVGTLASGFESSPFSRVGDACTQDADCGVGDTCLPQVDQDGATGFVEGYCVRFECSSSNACKEGASCVQLERSEVALCMADCRTGKDCRRGYSCHPQALVCVPHSG